MKHIKLFKEGFNREDYYVQIDKEESDDLLETFIDLSQETFDKINSRCTCRESRRNYIANGLHNIFLDGGKNQYPKRVWINELPDEYFLVRGEVDDIMSGPFNPAFIYFKCDQVEGVIELLKDYGYAI
jgi:hypothetical protein